VPYLEDFIGPPYVFTVDIQNKRQVKRAVKTALAIKVKKIHAGEIGLFI
jgi:ribosomal protein L23